MHAVRIHQHGGPEALVFEALERPAPKQNEVLLQVEAVGVNFIDVYRREGLYPVALPHTLGSEAAGMVVAVGEGVQRFKVGDRVAGVSVAGAYAEYAVAPADTLVVLPEGVSSAQAAAVLLQGMTAHYLVNDTYPLQGEQTCVVLAAAGGVGLLLVQLAKAKGARVIAVASTAEKRERAQAAGADAVLPYDDFAREVRRLTDGEGAHVVYDSVGQASFDESLACLRRRGLLALFGQSSGPVPPVDPQQLNAMGSLYLTRPSLYHYVATRAELEARAGEVLSQVAAGALTVRIDSTLPLREAAEAHRRLEARETSGKVLLEP
jgi:NADPH2:quinone reductase